MQQKESKKTAKKIEILTRKCEKTSATFATHSEYATAKELYKDPRLKTKERYMHQGLLLAFDDVRKQVGRSLLISSGRRSQEAQDELRKSGYRAAKVSPHVYGLAIDVIVPNNFLDEEFASLFEGPCFKHTGHLPRLGYKSYRNELGASSQWIHVDVCPSVYEEGKYPKVWGIQGLIF